MFCRRCGLKAERDDAFCFECGAPLREKRSPHDPNRVYGPSGSRDPNRAYGQNSSYEPETYRPSRPRYTQPPKRSFKVPIIIGVVCLVVVLAGVYMMNRGLSSNPLIGTWEHIDEGDLTFTFNRDGSFVMEMPIYLEGPDVWGREIEITYARYLINDNKLRVYDDYGNDFGDEMRFRISDDRLIIYDEWDEQHFIRR